MATIYLWPLIISSSRLPMNDEIVPSGQQSPLESFTEKLNLPQLVAGPAGKAISRLVAGAIEIPAAYLDSFAQSLKDKTATRTIVNNEVALAAAKLAANDTNIVARAAHNLLAKEYRHQKNKEEIARKTIEIPQESETQPESPETIQNAHDIRRPNVDDDWLNVFERYAQDASSERLQQLWARILAGEIRKPTTFSLKTLRFVSELDKLTAELFEQQAPLICNDSIFIEASLQGKPFTDLMHLQDAGLISGIGGLVQKKFTLNEKGQILLSQQNHMLLIEGQPGYVISVSAALLTNVGREIANIIKAPFSLDAGAEVAKRIPKAKLTSISYAGVLSSKGGIMFVPAHIFWTADAAKQTPPA